MSEETKNVMELSRAIARIHAGVLALVFGLIGGFGLFAMTAWLILKGGPEVGPHLQLLSNYFPGYSVTWGGGILGLFWGMLIGGIVGWSIGQIYNRIVSIRFRG